MTHPVIGADPGPMARLDAVKADAGAPSVIFQRLAEGESLKEIAKEWRVAKGRFIEWFTVTHADLYDAALKVRAADLALEALSIADTTQAGVTRKTKADGSEEVTEEDMLGHRKLQVETRLKLASKWDRARYGETVRVEKSVSVSVDAGLLGAAGDLLRLVASGQPRGRVVEGDTVTLPAPDEGLI